MDKKFAFANMLPRRESLNRNTQDLVQDVIYGVDFPGNKLAALIYTVVLMRYEPTSPLLNKYRSQWEITDDEVDEVVQILVR